MARGGLPPGDHSSGKILQGWRFGAFKLPLRLTRELHIEFPGPRQHRLAM